MTSQEHVARGAEPAVVGPYLAKVFEDDAWLDVDVDLIGGGKSNLTYLLTAGDREVVLRRPPLGHVLPTAHDMVREYTVLSALGPTGVPAPQVLHLCGDDQV